VVAPSAVAGFRLLGIGDFWYPNRPVQYLRSRLGLRDGTTFSIGNERYSGSVTCETLRGDGAPGAQAWRLTRAAALWRAVRGRCGRRLPRGGSRRCLVGALQAERGAPGRAGEFNAGSATLPPGAGLVWGARVGRV